MRRTFLLCALAAALIVPAVSLSADSPSDGTLSMKRGKGLVVLKIKGTVIGRFAKGRLQIRDFRPFDDQDPQFIGCAPSAVNLTTTACSGRNVSFRAVGGRYNISLHGSGIFLSVVGRGTVVVDGSGDEGAPNGVISLNGGPYESLPDIATSYWIGEPPPPRP